MLGRYGAIILSEEMRSAGLAGLIDGNNIYTSRAPASEVLFA
jgi:hypothetical protein